MQTIKFRFYDEDSVVPRLIYSDEYPSLNIYTSYHGLSNKHQQYTGLKDINKIEIYEGDILQNEDGDISAVTYDCGMFLCSVLSSECDSLYEVVNGYCVILGNIYENSELLENLESGKAK